MDINEKPLQVVIGIIGNSKGQFLLSTRRTKPIYDDYLEFPGGKVKPLETNEGALIRELREEVKINAEEFYAMDSVVCQFDKINIELHPYYEGFRGTVIKNYGSPYKYLIKGKYEVINSDTVKITELPIGSWTDDYKAYLEKLISSDKHSGIIKKYIDTSTDINVDIVVKFGSGKLDKLISKQETNNIDGVEKLLKLATTLSINNMHVFDEEDRLKKFNRPQDIIDYYFDIRLELYRQRKIKQLESLSKTLNKVSNKARFIKENLNNTIDLRGMKNEKVYSLLREKKYIVIDNDDKYEYLLGMPLSSVTRENIDKLLKQQESFQQEVDILTKTTPEDIWLADLTKLKENL